VPGFLADLDPKNSKAHVDHITVIQDYLVVNSLAPDKRAVLAVQVLQQDSVMPNNELAMVPAHQRAGKSQIAIASPPDEELSALDENFTIDVLPHDRVQCNFHRDRAPLTVST
jgi:hypothetical protein